jgi:hypothetical protein
VHKAKRRGNSSYVAIKQVFLSTMSRKDQVMNDTRQQGEVGRGKDTPER